MTTDTNKYGKFSDLLHEYNPYQTLHDSLYSALNNSSLIPKGMEINSFIKTIVSFIGYTQSSLHSYYDNAACSSPNTSKDNETCILLLPPKPTQYITYTISNIKFAAPKWERETKTKLFAYITVFDPKLHLNDQKCIYKSDEIIVPKTKKGSKNNDDNGYIINLKSINVSLKCGEIYVFWIDVEYGNFMFGFSEYKGQYSNKDDKDVKDLDKRYPLLRNMKLYKWKDIKCWEYGVDNAKFKLFEIEFC
eukprot:464755_1